MSVSPLMYERTAFLSDTILDIDLSTWALLTVFLLIITGQIYEKYDKFGEILTLFFPFLFF